MMMREAPDKIKDYSQAFPQRRQLHLIHKNNRPIVYHNPRFNKHHYHIIDEIFMTSPLAHAYKTFMDSMGSDRQRRMFQGRLLNLAPTMLFIYFEDQQMFGKMNGEGVMMKWLSNCKETFIYALKGRLKYFPQHFSLAPEDTPDSHHAKWNLNKNTMRKLSVKYFDLFYNRYLWMRPRYYHSQWYADEHPDRVEERRKQFPKRRGSKPSVS